MEDFYLALFFNFLIIKQAVKAKANNAMIIKVKTP